MQSNHRKDLRAMPRKALCLALAAAFTVPAMAEDDEVERLIKPESNISVGVGNVSRDNQRFGVYNGLDRDGAVGLVDFSLIRRDDENATWFRAIGRNLGLSTRELRLEHERQGDWGYFLDFSETPRVTPYTVRTNVLGLETARQTVPSVAGASGSYTFRTERETTKLGFNKTILPELEFKLVFQNEEKEGKRLFGRGTGTAQEFLAEPINSTTRQVDAVLDYTGDKLQLSGGYYGSFYNNHNPVLHVAGGNAAFNSGVGSTGVAFDNIALPPDNYAHQFHLAGGYQFTNTTRGSFKVAKTRAIQEDNFMAVNFFNTANNGANANTSGRTSLGGRVDTTLVQVGVTSRPLPGLSLLGNFRYEDRDDETTVARYITAITGTGAAPVLGALPGTSTTDGYNEPRSLTIKSGKAEASYQLPEGFRVTGGVDVEQKERTMSGVRVVGYREKTDENTYRVELKRAMAETATGSLAYLHSERDGSGYRNLVTLNGTTRYPTYALSGNAFFPVTPYGLLQPIYIADRERDKVRLAIDWAPTDALSTQLVLEDAKDDYGRGRGNPDLGVRKGDARLYSVDVGYSLTENWKLTGWASRSETSMDQADMVGASAGCTAAVCGTTTPTAAQIAGLTQAQINTLLAGLTVWSSDQKNIVDSYSIGVRGKVWSNRLELGADYVYAHDKTAYHLGKLNSGTVAVAGLPDITYKQTTLKFFSRYAVNKDLAVRLDYIFDHRKTNDWTWANWTYTDGTQIVQRPEDKVHFIGVSANYSFR